MESVPGKHVEALPVRYNAKHLHDPLDDIADAQLLPQLVVVLNTGQLFHARIVVASTPFECQQALEIQGPWTVLSNTVGDTTKKGTC
ncbi:hypothetical protein DPEC_G00336880 [Dallia pectoralis]|uniref:Uncharacterized protein n=1 Tax=Dallia pectoralis TaxID=75939 RepID=A0ACC2F7D0_DALPE|nr:hypothetical protein DPEC_G00336880 [Dallia pectoralis]